MSEYLDIRHFHNSIQKTVLESFRGRVPNVYVPPGVSFLPHTIRLFDARELSQIRLYGDSRYALAGWQRGSYLSMVNRNDPCLHIQGSRGTEVSGLNIMGSNHKDGNLPINSYNDYIDPSKFRQPNISRMHSAIQIDGLPRPALNSASTLLRDLFIHGFDCGLVLDPSSGNNPNTSETYLDNVTITDCHTGIGGGHYQAKGLELLHTGIHRCFIGFDGTRHGQQTNPPPLVMGGEWDQLCYAFVVPHAAGTGCVVGTKFEALISIGIFGPNRPFSRHCPFKFTSCDFVLVFPENQPENPIPHLSGFADVIFDGCTISADQSLRFDNGGHVVFRDTTIHLNLTDPPGPQTWGKIKDSKPVIFFADPSKVRWEGLNRIVWGSHYKYLP